MNPSVPGPRSREAQTALSTRLGTAPLYASRRHGTAIANTPMNPPDFFRDLPNLRTPRLVLRKLTFDDAETSSLTRAIRR